MAWSDFKGVIDLVAMKSYLYEANGTARKGRDIPAECEAAKLAHEALVEMAAEGDDALLEEFFEMGTLPVEHLRKGLLKGVRERRVFPVLCAAAHPNIGADALLNIICEYMPSPLEAAPVKGMLNGKEAERKVADAGPVSAFVFKTVADVFAGRVSYFKVISGVLKNDTHLNNVRSRADERLSHIGCLQGKTIVPVTDLHAGDRWPS